MNNGVYDYFDKVYFINDKEIVNEMIENGNKKIDSIDIFTTYANLAIKFWEYRKKVFETKV